MAPAGREPAGEQAAGGWDGESTKVPPEGWPPVAATPAPVPAAAAAGGSWGDESTKVPEGWPLVEATPAPVSLAGGSGWDDESTKVPAGWPPVSAEADPAPAPQAELYGMFPAAPSPAPIVDLLGMGGLAPAAPAVDLLGSGFPVAVISPLYSLPVRTVALMCTPLHTRANSSLLLAQLE